MSRMTSLNHSVARSSSKPLMTSNSGVSNVSFQQGRAKLMRIYIFKSETTKESRAFAGDAGGTKLPESHAPWTVTGVIVDGKAPPHNLSRGTIEEAIQTQGFQLWRLSKKDR
jgi:hypothetical protein